MIAIRFEIFSFIYKNLFLENPREFLKEYLKSLKEAKERRADGPKLFGPDNLQSLFGMLDPVGSGHITRLQYLEGKHSIFTPFFF